MGIHASYSISEFLFLWLLYVFSSVQKKSPERSQKLQLLFKIFRVFRYLNLLQSNLNLTNFSVSGKKFKSRSLLNLAVPAVFFSQWSAGQSLLNRDYSLNRDSTVHTTCNYLAWLKLRQITFHHHASELTSLSSIRFINMCGVTKIQ